eukprot:scaffold45557_cov18-Tisochrysis_lutea.AAC.1
MLTVAQQSSVETTSNKDSQGARDKFAPTANKDIRDARCIEATRQLFKEGGHARKPILCNDVQPK